MEENFFETPLHNDWENIEEYLKDDHFIVEEGGGGLGANHSVSDY